MNTVLCKCDTCQIVAHRHLCTQVLLALRDKLDLFLQSLETCPPLLGFRRTWSLGVDDGAIVSGSENLKTVKLVNQQGRRVNERT
jgi:hypothetical protein